MATMTAEQERRLELRRAVDRYDSADSEVKRQALLAAPLAAEPPQQPGETDGNYARRLAGKRPLGRRSNVSRGKGATQLRRTHRKTARPLAVGHWQCGCSWSWPDEEWLSPFRDGDPDHARQGRYYWEHARLQHDRPVREDLQRVASRRTRRLCPRHQQEDGWQGLTLFGPEGWVALGGHGPQVTKGTEIRRDLMFSLWMLVTYLEDAWRVGVMRGQLVYDTPPIDQDDDFEMRDFVCVLCRTHTDAAWWIAREGWPVMDIICGMEPVRRGRGRPRKDADWAVRPGEDDVAAAWRREPWAGLA